MAGDPLLGAALASMPHGFSIWGEDRRLVLFNERYADMYHLPLERLHIGVSLREVAQMAFDAGDHAPLGVDEIYALYCKRFEERPDDADLCYQHKVRDRIIKSTNVRTRGLGWTTTHEDVTEEVRVQELAATRQAALEQQNVRFEAAVNNMAQGLCLFGADRRLVICNDTFAAMYSLPSHLLVPGVSLDELLDYRLANNLVPEGERRETYRQSRLNFANERHRVVRFVERERGRVISVIQQPMPDGGWVSTHQDITEQRHKEEQIQARKLELEVQNIRFDAAINNMSHGLSMFDADNKLIVCNRHYVDLYGLPPELTRPGTSFWTILEDGAKKGMVSVADPKQRRKVLGAIIDAGRPFKDNFEMVNGRIISVLHRPMTGGGWISTHEDVTEQFHHQESIRHLARHDALTGLPNRVLFGEEMAKLEGRIRRHENIAVLCVDLDHFKAVNDSLGHAVGDGVLALVAQRLRDASRESDVVARLGGDEFAVLAGPLDNPQNAAVIADRIVKSIGEPMMVDGNRIVIGASVGIAMAPLDGTDADSLLKSADLALYRAKGDGRGSYHFFERDMDEAARRRRALEHGLKIALERGEFRLVYQPILDLADHRITALEALLRWDHPERGLIEPAEFLPVAEDTGVIVAIGDWVLHEATAAAARWPADIRIAVNLSAVQFRDRGLVDCVTAALKAASLDPQRLEVEITEDLLFDDQETVLAVLQRLKAIGVRVSLDDFGTGYSSLNHLRHIAFDRIKIDRHALTEALGLGTDAAPVLDAVMALARTLGNSATAEGVETEEQLEQAMRNRCQQAQGYLFSPPLPASGIDALLGTLRANTDRQRRAAQ